MVPEDNSKSTKSLPEPTSDTDIEQILQEALSHIQGGRLEEAKHILQRSLIRKPDSSAARKLLGEVLRLIAENVAQQQEQSGLTADARRTGQKQQAMSLFNKATVLRNQGKFDEAIDFYQQAIAADPAFIPAYNDLGILFVMTERLKEALINFQNVVSLDPDSFIGYTQVGNTLKQLNRLDDAVINFRHAIAIDPGRAKLYVLLSQVLREQGQLSAAAATIEQALRLQPHDADTIFTLARLKIEQGQVDSAMDLYRQTLQIKPNHIGASGGSLFDMHYLPNFSPDDLLTAAKDFVRHYATRQRCLPPPINSANHKRRLRVGYVSADFNGHPVGLFMELVMAHHDKSHYEIYCYYNNTKFDDYTSRLKKCADHWRTVNGISDEELALQIRQDEIDLLVDLSGYTGKSRILAFAHKPAPVQITWLGYCDTTGMDAIDYIIADRFVIPAEYDHYYVEKVERLPNAYLCFSPPEAKIEPGPLPALATGKVTFGCFNNPAKITDAVIACWSRLLRALPTSQLYLKYAAYRDAGVRQRYQALFAQQGIEPERIRFAGLSPRNEYHLAYQEVDIGLDPYPFNGCATTLESLWMGIPIVTLRDRGYYRFVNRMGETLLTNVGLGECVMDSEDKYIAKAVSLAADLPSLAKLRYNLRSQLLSSPLSDGFGFTRDLEAIYRKMWEAWCQL